MLLNLDLDFGQIAWHAQPSLSLIQKDKYQQALHKAYNRQYR
jgi:hypothetical protein